MSGAHSQFRTGNRPLFDESGEPVLKLDSQGRPVQEHRLVPIPRYENGRPVGYTVIETFAQRHVLDYSPAQHFRSKHARGRIRPRTRAEQRRAAALQARFVRLSKRVTVMQQQGVVFDEVQALAAL